MIVRLWMHRGMISFAEDEKLDYEREWEKKNLYDALTTGEF